MADNLVKVKVCGITRAEDALLAARLGAWAVGFIFHPGSPRCVTPQAAAQMVAQLPPFLTTVGVFVHHTPQEINAICRQARLDRAQLHGGQGPEALAQLERPGYRVVRVAGQPQADLALAQPDATLLLDTLEPEKHGGTGQSFDWALAAQVAQAKRVILAGGLGPHNALAAWRQARPYALDVNSGVESAPGLKDPAKLAALFKALREVG